MKVAIGSDHGGFDLKTALVEHLKARGEEVTDFGTYDKNSCDYPIYGEKVARAVAAGEVDRGIVVCTTGIGISITANKIRGIRCALCSEVTSARLTREHNDANVLALGGGFVGPLLAAEIVDTFLDTEFSGLEKHSRRISKITELEG
ncbi:MAG: ribose 5-phosphate isomerase B [Butyrivibrio sp.]|nr:ribose 5-phosphate isomerase B [Butyrivibrio sp.]